MAVAQRCRERARCDRLVGFGDEIAQQGHGVAQCAVAEFGRGALFEVHLVVAHGVEGVELVGREEVVERAVEVVDILHHRGDAVEVVHEAELLLAVADERGVGHERADETRGVDFALAQFGDALFDLLLDLVRLGHAEHVVEVAFARFARNVDRGIQLFEPFVCGGHAEHAARHERRTGADAAQAAVRRRKDFGEGAVHPFGDAAVFAHAARREVAVAVAGVVGDDLDAVQGLFAQRREFTCFGRLAKLCARIFVDALRGVPTRAVAAVVADVEGFVAFGRGRRRCAGVVLVAVVERRRAVEVFEGLFFGALRRSAARKQQNGQEQQDRLSFHKGSFLTVVFSPRHNPNKVRFCARLDEKVEFHSSFSRLGIVRTAFGSALGLTKTFVIGFYSVIFRMTAETGFIFKVDSPFFEVYFAPSPVP